MALPPMTELGGIVVVAVAAMRLLEVVTGKLFKNGANRLDEIEHQLRAVIDIVSVRDDEGTYLISYPKRMYTALENILTELRCLRREFRDRRGGI